MPAVLPFIPLIAAGIGGGVSLYQGYKADQRNQQQIGQAQQSQGQQQALITQMMQGVNPAAYQAQARGASQGALGQIASDFAQRGLNSSGAMYTAGANATNQAYTGAAAQYQHDRMSAYGAAMGGQQAVTQGYGQFVNPDPYGGLGQSLGAIGQAGAAYYGNQQPAAPTPLPGFGVRAPVLPGWSAR